MKKLILLSVLLFCVSKGWGYESMVSSKTITCELCNQTTTFYTAYYTFTRTRPDGWIQLGEVYYHKDCWQKFQKFLIELYLKSEKQIKYTVIVDTDTKPTAYYWDKETRYRLHEIQAQDDKIKETK